MKKTFYRAAAATVLGLSLATGMAAADTGNISHTGPSSDNNITTTTTNSSTVDNSNGVGLVNLNGQLGFTGDAHASHNTSGGDARSGAVTNTNTVGADVTVDNSGSSAPMVMPGTGMNSGMMDHTGPDSKNNITTTTPAR